MIAMIWISCCSYVPLCSVAGRPQVAFSASISTPPQENLGPFANETKLVFNKVLTNIGDAYSPDTGLSVRLTTSLRLPVCVAVGLFVGQSVR